MASSNVILSEMTLPPVGAMEQTTGASHAVASHTGDATRERAVTAKARKRARCKTCSGKSCNGRCRF